jgi:hypothetical protein
MDCLDYVERSRLSDVGGDLSCPVCGSRRIAVLDADEDDVRALLNGLLERGRAPRDLEQLHRRALSTSALVEKHGYAGAWRRSSASRARPPIASYRSPSGVT